MTDPTQWKADFMRLWGTHSSRQPDALDLRSFSVLLGLAEPVIKEQLDDRRNPTPQNPAEDANQPGAVALIPPQLDAALQLPKSLTTPSFEPSWTTSGHEVPSVDLSALSGIDSEISSYTTASINATSTGKSTTQSSCSGQIVNETTHTVKAGLYPCTLGCGRLFKVMCDRKRHEETVYPQNYWVCYVCTQGKPSKGEYFIWLDKLQNHNRKCHADQLDLQRCKVLGIRTLMPELCGLCQYCFRSMADRYSHIKEQHSGRSSLGRQPSLILKSTSESMNGFSLVNFQYLETDPVYPEQKQSTQPVALHWLEEINRGGTAVVFKVRTSVDLSSAHHAGTGLYREYACKQISRPQYSHFKRELEIYSNRVGTFDEAFRSRIQIAVHYPSLRAYQRLQIWKNFLDRVESFKDGSVNVEELRDHLEELQNLAINGSQVRNATTTARQFAD
ncbi:hypothetical protein OPT61_g9969 [Boeremia exigua]|uniref:Uncharacterized protein n=1 Tax=Boeremia exigua TaxID=749465 RepID=A0ACC2HS06_9PLEO|nr:hypothetical protein OPT61_g9969 [Boeremia exigua]